MASLGSLELQLTDSGIALRGIEIVTENQPWLLRDFLLSVRASDDSQPYEVSSIVSKRTVIQGNKAIPMNNATMYELASKTFLRQQISVTGTCMLVTDFASLLTNQAQAAEYWAKYDLYRAQLAQPDLSETKVTDTIQLLQGLNMPKISLSSPLWSGAVYFDRGNSCTAAAFTGLYTTKFSFALLADIPLGG